MEQLYKELVRIHDPGDRIFLFGFSRGAFTVRTLAGLIAAFCRPTRRNRDRHEQSRKTDSHADEDERS
ncbi:phospholipase effector Tle1 domain-containing protein [Nitrospira sp. Nam80]